MVDDSRAIKALCVAAKKVGQSNKFVSSCMKFYTERGFLSDKQIAVLLKMKPPERGIVDTTVSNYYEGAWDLLDREHDDFDFYNYGD